MRQLLFFLILVWLSACGQATHTVGSSEAPAAIAETKPASALPPLSPTNLPGFFDCVRDTDGLLIAAHRGGPAPGYPENALETLQYGYSQGLRVFEIDTATSRDGVLFLLHDRSLGRTTTAEGQVADTDWADIARSRLKDNDGKVTDLQPPKLTDVLIWARETGAILELDKKATTGWRSLIAAVRAAQAENHVILITYSNEDAALVQRLAPDMMLTASARGSRDIAELSALGVNPKHLIAWTGTRAPDAAAWARNAAESVESGFGTLGRPGERLDDTYLADGDLSEYRALVEDGLVLLATDAPYQVAEALIADDRALNACAG